MPAAAAADGIDTAAAVADTPADTAADFETGTTAAGIAGHLIHPPQQASSGRHRPRSSHPYYSSPTTAVALGPANPGGACLGRHAGYPAGSAARKTM